MEAVFEKANPLVDCVFKKLFGSEKNKNLLLSLVNGIIEGNEPKVVELQILNPYNLQEFSKDKLSILDIKAKNEVGEWFIIEVQIEMTWYFPKRLLYYWAKNYQSTLAKGEEYNNLKKVSLICFCSDALPLKTKKYLNYFQILEKESHINFCEDLNIYTIELSKFTRQASEIRNDAELWSFFLKNAPELDIEALPEKLNVPIIQQAVKECIMFTQNEIERDLYESRLKEQRDRLSLLKDRYQKGLQEGLQKGEQLGLQKGKEVGLQEGLQKGEQLGLQKTAQEAFKLGLDLESIKKITGLSVEELKKIQRKK